MLDCLDADVSPPPPAMLISFPLNVSQEWMDGWMDHMAIGFVLFCLFLFVLRTCYTIFHDGYANLFPPTVCGLCGLSLSLSLHLTEV